MFDVACEIKLAVDIVVACLGAYPATVDKEKSFSADADIVNIVTDGRCCACRVVFAVDVLEVSSTIVGRDEVAVAVETETSFFASLTIDVVVTLLVATPAACSTLDPVVQAVADAVFFVANGHVGAVSIDNASSWFVVFTIFVVGITAAPVVIMKMIVLFTTAVSIDADFTVNTSGTVFTWNRSGRYTETIVNDVVAVATDALVEVKVTGQVDATVAILLLVTFSSYNWNNWTNWIDRINQRNGTRGTAPSGITETSADGVKNVDNSSLVTVHAAWTILAVSSGVARITSADMLSNVFWIDSTSSIDSAGVRFASVDFAVITVDADWTFADVFAFAPASGHVTLTSVYARIRRAGIEDFTQFSAPSFVT